MISIPPPLMAAARGRPDHSAIILGDQVISWRELAHRAACWARALVDEGIGPGDVIELELGGEVDVESIIKFHAVGLAGAIVAPRSRPCPWPAALPSATALDERDWPLHEPRLSLLTSGSSGQQREVVLTTAQLMFSAMGSAARLGHHTDDRWLACLPFHHVGGLSILFRTAWLESTAVIEPRFVAAKVAALLDSGEITVVSLVPAMLARLLDAREHKPFPSRLRLILLGGDRAPPPLLARARAIGAPVALTWGMTETASQIATGFDALRPLPFCRVLNDPESDALVVEGPVAPGGRLVTSDRGSVNDGVVDIQGRRDLVFVSGGENVDPLRVERALSQHPAVAQALVVGLPDPVLGQRAGAVLVPTGACERPDLATLRAFLTPELAPAERPSRVVWAAAIPVSPAGKPSRERARALLEDVL